MAKHLSAKALAAILAAASGGGAARLYLATGGPAPAGRGCPDGGTCHHQCGEEQPCFRVLFCGPLSAAHYPGDLWPPEIVLAEAERGDAHDYRL